MDLPPTLHGQLYLLAYDRRRQRRECDQALLGYALRAAALTDLYLTDYIEDEQGRPRRLRDTCPDDPLLRDVFERIGVTGARTWAELIAENPKKVRNAVRDQLQAGGWLAVRRRAMAGVIPARLAPCDEDMVGALAERVSRAFDNAIDGTHADPRHLAVGLLGVLGQLPTVLSFEEQSRHRQALRDLTLAAIEPILGLHQAVLKHLEDARRSISLSS